MVLTAVREPLPVDGPVPDSNSDENGIAVVDSLGSPRRLFFHLIDLFLTESRVFSDVANQ